MCPVGCTVSASYKTQTARSGQRGFDSLSLPGALYLQGLKSPSYQELYPAGVRVPKATRSYILQGFESPGAIKVALFQNYVFVDFDGAEDVLGEDPQHPPLPHHPGRVGRRWDPVGGVRAGEGDV